MVAHRAALNTLLISRCPVSSFKSNCKKSTQNKLLCKWYTNCVR